MLARRLMAATAVGIIALNASFAWAQQEPAKPATPTKETKPAKEAKSPKEGRNAKPAEDFPKKVKKNLYATKDVRGDQAPKIEFGTWLNGKPDTKDKVILIDFWATWCGPCRALIPELAGWQEKFKDDLVVIGISDEKPDKVREFFKKDKMKYSMAVDQKGATKKSLGISGIPHVLIIGTDNVVRWQGFPGSEEDTLTEETLKKIIDADKARREAAAKKADGQKSKDEKRASDSSEQSDKQSSSDSKKDSQSESKRESKSDSGKNPK